MTPAEMDRVIEQHMRAEGAGDLDAAVAVYPDDVEHDVVGAPGGPLRGPAAARARYAELMGNVRTEAMVLRHRYHGRRRVHRRARGHGHGRRTRRRENVRMDTATLLAQLSAPASVRAG